MGQCWMFPPEAHTSANPPSCQVYCALNFNCCYIYASNTRRLRLQTGITLKQKARQGAKHAKTMEGGDSWPLDSQSTCIVFSFIFEIQWTTVIPPRGEKLQDYYLILAEATQFFLQARSEGSIFSISVLNCLPFLLVLETQVLSKPTSSNIW